MRSFDKYFSLAGVSSYALICFLVPAVSGERDQSFARVDTSVNTSVNTSANILAGADVAGRDVAGGDPAFSDKTDATASSGVTFTAGFSSTVFARDLGVLRHIDVADNGWVYAALMRGKDGKGAVALKDDDGDGIADQIHYFAPDIKGTGLALQGNYLYFGADDRIVRYPLDDGPVPSGEGEVMVSGFPEQRAHASKPITFDNKGYFYVNVGVPSNACMEKTRQKGSPGQTPCPELDNHGGIYRFKADQPGQRFDTDGYRYSTGHRNVNALDWNESANVLYVVQHGRDQLGQFFPDLYDAQASAELPAEEFHQVLEGDNLGWPYSYFDHRKGARMVMPEYGGDGETVSDIGKKPLIGFPGHWAPNDLIFVEGKDAPAALKRGALIAFHGSWNRAPLPQAGYRVVFVPMSQKGDVSGDWSTFADGFAQSDLRSPGQAEHRPMGLAEGPDGAIFITSSSSGTIWRVTSTEKAQ